MNSIVLINILVILLLCGGETLAQISSDGKLFLLGGATKDSSQNIYNQLKTLTGKELPNIAVAISAAPSLQDGLDAFYKTEEGSLSYEQLFMTYGFYPTVVYLAIDNYEDGSSSLSTVGRLNIQKIKEADVIFFNGGDQARHTRSWLTDDGKDTEIMVALKNRLQEGAIIAGTSAGTAVQCNPLFGSGTSYGYSYFNVDLKSCNIGEELADDRDGTNSFRYDENGAKMQGFGFLHNALLDTHFDARGRFGRLIVAMKDANVPYGIGVDEDTAIYVENNTGTVIGNSGIWIIDASEATYKSEEYFNVDGIRFHYLTENDSFDFVSGKLSTSKLNIIPDTEGIYDSNDIFYDNEGVKSFISLMQSIDYNNTLGLSYEDKPTVHVKIGKDSSSRGYKLGNKYAMNNLMLQIETY